MLRSIAGSIVSLSFLALFLGIIIFLVFYFTQLYAAVGLIGILVVVAVIFAISWRVGPRIHDVIYKWFYGLKWLEWKDFAAMEPDLAAFVKQICSDDKISLPKIGYIADNNPQAFSYGSDHWNARVVFTEGIRKYLNPNEKKAVLAHEVGHIVHKDFIIMTLATFIITAFYVIGRALIKTRGRKNPLPIIGLFSLLLYYIGTYVLLYLSRLREYYADYYAKQKLGTGNYLSSALVKIAYGILSSQDSVKTRELMEGTRTLGIYDHKHAQQFGLAGADYIVDKDTDAITSAMVYDTHNYWAFWMELSSSHPLTGKRINLLLKDDKKPMFDLSKVNNYPFDYSRHRREFAKDWIVAYLWLIAGLAVAGLCIYFNGIAALWQAAFAGIAVVGLALLLKAFYRYPKSGFSDASVLSLMSNVYASPIRGIPSKLSGRLVGRGTPGFIFSEDMMLQDKTGLLYLDYRNLIPFLGDIYFAVAKVKGLIGQSVSCEGWFFRGFSQHLALNQMTSGTNIIKSRQRLLSIVGAAIVILIGLAGLGILQLNHSIQVARGCELNPAMIGPGMGFCTSYYSLQGQAINVTMDKAYENNLSVFSDLFVGNATFYFNPSGTPNGCTSKAYQTVPLFGGLPFGLMELSIPYSAVSNAVVSGTLTLQYESLGPSNVTSQLPISTIVVNSPVSVISQCYWVANINTTAQ